jgi:hypothetical protein
LEIFIGILYCVIAISIITGGYMYHLFSNVLTDEWTFNRVLSSSTETDLTQAEYLDLKRRILFFSFAPPFSIIIFIVIIGGVVYELAKKYK